jgi:hypothetical protein
VLFQYFSHRWQEGIKKQKLSIRGVYKPSHEGLVEERFWEWVMKFDNAVFLF